MILHVLEAEYRHDFVIWLCFNDGSAGEVNLEGSLHGEVFRPLKDLENFKKFRVDAELNTMVWENGADLAPEFLHDRLRILT